MVKLRAWGRARLIAACWALLTWLEASCPVCAAPVASSLADAVRACAVCGQPLPKGTIRQHDGRYLCRTHKGAV